ncbi:MAG: biotin transporter BioY [Oscillospiraceae bacterium]|nr:biotin transporter BioY [Oscillospiraceae bacterium]
MSEATVSGKRSLSTTELVYIAVCAALMAVCSWISIPAPAPLAPFTLQTFAVFLILLLLGGKRGFFTILTYILLGAVGLPVFAQFMSGVGVLFGTTGGYIIGFLFSALLYWVLERFIEGKGALQIGTLVLGLIVCYAFGTAWFMVVYARQAGPVGLATALGWCVLPFIIPDLAKLALAWCLGAMLKKHVHL